MNLLFHFDIRNKKLYCCVCFVDNRRIFMPQVIEVTMRQPMLTPVCDNSQDVCKEVLSSIVNSSSANPHIDELRRLIQKPQFKVSDGSLTLTESNSDS